MVGGTIQGSVHWDGTGDTVTLYSNMTISQGAILTIGEGQTVKLRGTGDASLTVYGTLIATGVLFTSQDQSKHWGGISFSGAGSTLSILDGCTFEYAKRYLGGVIFIQNSSPTIKRCTIDKCGAASYGIRISNGLSVINSNNINRLNNSGIYVNGLSSPTVTGNTITDNIYGIFIYSGSGNYQSNTIKNNRSFGLYYSGTTVIDATNCDWGVPSGPYDPSDDRATGGLYNPNGKGNKVSDHVNYDP